MILTPELRIVTDEAWQAAHARLAEARALYLRANDGQLWGHPARGTESKYLLTGLARCGQCGAGLSVRSRSHGKRRAYFYVCTAFHGRGRTVCPNSFELPMTRVDAVILTEIGKRVLSPDVIDATISRALAAALRPGHDA